MDFRRIVSTVFLWQLAASVCYYAVFASTPFFRDQFDLSGTAVAFVVLGFFVLRFTGIYYSCMATLVSADRMGSATGGGQLALVTGALVAPPVFGYLADAYSYRVSWFMLAALSLAATVFVVRVIVTEPPASVTAAATVVSEG